MLEFANYSNTEPGLLVPELRPGRDALTPQSNERSVDVGKSGDNYVNH